MLNRRTLLFYATALILPAGMPRPCRASEILVSAAASLTDALGAVGKAFSRVEPGVTVRFNFASSGALQRQIEQGAPVDVFISASPVEMDALQREHDILPATRFNCAGNRLVLIVPLRSTVRTWNDLRRRSVHRVAISDPGSVPSGRYAKATLIHRGLWNAVSRKAVLGENVRQTLTYVVDGDVDAGVVFATDARIESHRVKVAQAAVPGRDHAPIVYPAAVVNRAPDAALARRFLLFLKSRTAQSILAGYGFSPPPPLPRRTGR